MLRWFAFRISSVARLRWFSSKKESIPEKKSRQTMLKNPTVTRFRIPFIISRCIIFNKGNQIIRIIHPSRSAARG